ncbi:MAG: hypothetical protein H6841_07710 [Planctomycetes bacterium]|nr:hypothetical protein [Planctomycetota bacterium]MCB9935244.1 hypothetical protein [Planctomycetota bacterium]
MKTPVHFLIALALLALPFFSATSDACPACEARANANRPLNRHDIWTDETLRDVIVPNRLDILTEPTLRDVILPSRLDIYTEPTLRDEVRLNCLTIETEPTLRDTVIDEPVSN